MIKDANILLSVLNTKLRDEYSSLEDLVRSEDLDLNEIENILSSIGYKYSQNENRFILE